MSSEAKQIYQKSSRNGEECTELVGGVISHVLVDKSVEGNEGFQINVIDKKEFGDRWMGQLIRLSVCDKVSLQLGLVDTMQIVSFLNRSGMAAVARGADGEKVMYHKDITLLPRWTNEEPEIVKERVSLQEGPMSEPIKVEITARDAEHEETLRIETLSAEEIERRKDEDGHSVQLFLDDFKTTITASACTWLIDKLLFALAKAIGMSRVAEEASEDK